MARRRIVPVPVPSQGPGTSATHQPGPATATFADPPMPINRPYVAPYSPEFRHQAVLLTLPPHCSREPCCPGTGHQH